MPIRDPSEDERSDYSTHDIEGCDRSEIGAGKMKRLGALQSGTQRTDDGDFEPVKNPGDTKPYHDQQVEPTPRQPIKAKGDAGPNHGLRLRSLRHPHHF